MTRTAHHIAAGRTAGSGLPLRRVVLHGLRYSAARLGAPGGRPRPEAVRRSAEVYRWARSDVRDRSLRRAARLDERRARQRLRRELGRLMARQDWEEPDVTPARHRHNAVWQY